MNRTDVKSLMDQALSMDYGLCLSLSSESLAQHYRRKFYAAREDARKFGNYTYDDLSFIVINSVELWILKRDVANQSSSVYFQNSRPIELDELPPRILSRGKSRVGVDIL